MIPVITTDVLTGTTLTRSATGFPFVGGIVDRVATINYGGLAGLTLNAGATPNVITVEGTSAPTTVNAGSGNRQVTVSPTAESLDTVAGPLTVDGGGATQLVIDDQKANTTGVIPVITTDVLTGTTLTRSATGFLFVGGIVDRVATINYGGLAGLTLNAGATPNVITVEGTSTATTVAGGAGTTQVTVSPTAESLDTIAGPLTVDGGGATQLVIDDQKANTTGVIPVITTDVLTGTTLTRSAMGFPFVGGIVNRVATINYGGPGRTDPQRRRHAQRHHRRGHIRDHHGERGLGQPAGHRQSHRREPGHHRRAPDRRWRRLQRSSSSTTRRPTRRA